ncbi:MAG: serine/threonine protein kinase [Planctomycetes bacterium]|nr:serine/threonine protein kinase [Planctomycetota bacterium]
MSPSIPSSATPSPDTDLSGRQFGDYLVLRRLGSGGMADVYLAEQKSLHRQVAFKALHARLADDDIYVRRFHNEAQAVAALVHANIVQIYGVDCIDGVHFIAQEYVPGQNLQQLLSKRGTLSIAIVVNLMRQVAAALQKASDRGIVHRDIKPENILLNATGEAKVADFGLARIADLTNDTSVGITQVGITMGTPLYMSPEQVEGHEIDHRSDLYSFGISCYQMLTGHPPFRGDTALSVAVQHLKNDPRPIGELRSDLPAELGRIICKLLAKSVDDRYQNAAELLRELRELQVESSHEEWPTELGEWTTQQLLALTAARTAATQQLQTVMIAEAAATKSRPISFWITVAAFGAFLLGCAVAWINRPDSLLAHGEVPSVERFDTAAEQFSHAMQDGTESAFQSVFDYFGEDAAAASESYVNKAKLQLAYLYSDQERTDEAMRLLAELSDQQTDLQLRAMSLIRQANIHAQRSQIAEASQKTFALAELIEDTENLTPRQRQTLRTEAQTTLAPQLLANFRLQLRDS